MDQDVIIVGAGLVGLSLARALDASGLKVALLGSAPPPAAPAADDWDPRVYALSPGSCAFLERCGAWQRIAPERIAAVESMHVYGDGQGARLQFDAYDAGLRELCRIVESREIERALAAALDTQTDLTRIAAEPLALAFGADGVELALAGGARIGARLIVGADGARSWVRETAGIAVESHDYQQTAVVANFETEHAHAGIARQWFRADGVLALLPLPGNRVSLVWSTEYAFAERLLAMDGGGFEQLVAAAAADADALGAMHLIGERRAFPLRRQRVEALTRPRVALIGDAAHTVHPLAGQGVNLGFQDARALASVLIARGAQGDCGDARLLRRYARARAETIAVMLTLTHALQRLFGVRNAGVAWVRNAGLAATDSIPGLKKVLIEHALG